MQCLYFKNREITTGWEGAGGAVVNGKSFKNVAKSKIEKGIQIDPTSKVCNATLCFCPTYLLDNSEYAFQINF